MRLAVTNPGPCGRQVCEMPVSRPVARDRCYHDAGQGCVRTFDQFHDGFVDGLLLGNDGVRLFLSTGEKQSFVLDVAGLRSLRLNDFREGNIIFDVVVRDGDEVTSRDMVELFGFSDEEKALQKLEEAHREGLIVIEINPSYGASCLMLASSMTLTS